MLLCRCSRDFRVRLVFTEIHEGSRIPVEWTSNTWHRRDVTAPYYSSFPVVFMCSVRISELYSVNLRSYHAL